MKLNTTEHYHRHDLQTLGWELTVCNALMPLESPCRKILQTNQSYGHFLYDFINRFAAVSKMTHIIEVGGGYGYLMRDFLDRCPSLKATMLDISPYLLEKQRETLKGRDVAFRHEDFLKTDLSTLIPADLAILNENVGDFPTVIDVCTAMLDPATTQPGEGLIADISHFFNRYHLDIPPFACFHFNLGAAKTAEKLCAASIPAIFISEHSCEARTPAAWQSVLKLEKSGMPERIALRGHDEYTIQFSYLEKIAAAHDYRITRGPFFDFIPLEMTDRLQCCLKAPAARTDEDEIIRHFVEDLFKYEYLLLTKPENPAQDHVCFDHRPHPSERMFRRADHAVNGLSWKHEKNPAGAAEHAAWPTSSPM